jgi:acetyl esterase
MEPLPEFLPLLSRHGREPDPGPVALADFRAAMNRALVKWSAPGPAAGRVRDLAAEGPYRPIPLRVYEPAGPGAPARPGPVILFCHGSGFVLGNLDTHDWLARSLCAAVGAVVVSVDYLLAPEHPFPAALDECVAVLGWVAAGGAGRAADPARIIVAGDSAGGALVAGVSRTARDRGSSQVCAQLLIYPVCGHELDTPSWHRYGGGGYFLDAPTMRWFWSQYLHEPGQASNPYAVPLAAREFQGLPPAVLLVAGCDPLADEGREYAARLRAGGTQVRVVEYAGAIHGFMTMSAISPSAAAAVEQVAVELRELTGRQVTA